MIEFHRLTLSQKEQYNQILLNCPERGCEYSFANLYLWGRQEIAFLHDCVGFFSHFHGRSVYPFPIGPGDKRAVIEDYIRDSRKRGIPCRITGMTEADLKLLEAWYPGKFQLCCDRDSFDYVYSIDDLADLRGRKYQKKRNHFNRFQAGHPDYQFLPLTPDLLPEVKKMVENWYDVRQQSDPHGNYLLEKLAISRVFHHLEELEMEGCALLDGGEVLAVTMGSQLSANTFDIHFEKAREDVDGAYTAVNCEFARYLRLKYPNVQFLNREEDLGLEGLRKAKLSYLPHHMVEKCWAYLAEDLYED